MSRDWNDERGRDDERRGGQSGARRFGPSEGRGYGETGREDDGGFGGYGDRPDRESGGYGDRMYGRGEGAVSEDRWSSGRETYRTASGGRSAREVFGDEADYGTRRGAPGYPRYGQEVGYLDRGYGSDRPYPGEAADRSAGSPSPSGYGGEERGDRASGAGAGHRGRGPKGYRRSDDRIREDVHDRLTDDGMLDASEITVQVRDCEVTLDGTVDSRFAKRRAEDLVESVPGVTHCQNNLRVRPAGERRPGGGETSATLSHAESVLSGLSNGGQYSGLEGASGSGPDGTSGQTTAFSGKKTDLADRNEKQ